MRKCSACVSCLNPATNFFSCLFPVSDRKVSITGVVSRNSNDDNNSTVRTPDCSPAMHQRPCHARTVIFCDPYSWRRYVAIIISVYNQEKPRLREELLSVTGLVWGGVRTSSCFLWSDSWYHTVNHFPNLLQVAQKVLENLERFPALQNNQSKFRVAEFSLGHLSFFPLFFLSSWPIKLCQALQDTWVGVGGPIEKDWLVLICPLSVLPTGLDGLNRFNAWLSASCGRPVKTTHVLRSNF